MVDRRRQFPRITREDGRWHIRVFRASENGEALWLSLGSTGDSKIAHSVFLGLVGMSDRR